jgi:hypothetical protein
VKNAIILAFLALAASLTSAQSTSLLLGIEAHIGLILLIASAVIIILMILMILYLHSIAEHLNWIRRIR